MRTLLLLSVTLMCLAGAPAFAADRSPPATAAAADPLTPAPYGISHEDLSPGGIESAAKKKGPKWCQKHPKKCTKKGGY